MEKVAIIDIGSARLKMQISEVLASGAKTVFQYKEESHLSANIKKDGLIDISFIETEFSVILKRFIDKVKINKCSKVLVIGTHALRTIKNSAEVLNILENIAGRLSIILPWEEGAIIYEWMCRLSDSKNFAFIDVGGGSVQLSFGNKESDVFSIPSGTFTLEKLFQSSLEYASNVELDKMRDYIFKEYDKLSVSDRNIDFLYFGSNCMERFISSSFKQGRIDVESTDKIHYSKFNSLYNMIKEKRYDELYHYYLENKMFMHGADKALLNLLVVCDILKCSLVTPTNESLSSALIHLMSDAPDELTKFNLNVNYL